LLQAELKPNRRDDTADAGYQSTQRHAWHVARPPRRARRFGYLTWLAAIGVAAFALCWVFVAAAPMTFMDDEYPRWQAKEAMLASCDLGTFMIAGDSRAAVDIAPVQLPMRVTNLALAGTTPIETYVTIKRALRCPDPPAGIIVSISPSHFVAPDTFWGKSVRYGFLSSRDLFQLRDISLRLGNTDVLRPEAPDGLSIVARILLYESRFPAVYLGSLYHNLLAFPYWRNEMIYDHVLRSRGQYYFALQSGPHSVGPEGELADFAAQPVLDAYFDKILVLTTARHVPVYFIAMPLDADTFDAVPLAEQSHFAEYLRRYAARHANFHVLTEPMPHWPNRYFADSLSHMNPTGVAALNEKLAACLAHIVSGPPGVKSCLLDFAPPG